MAASQGKKKKCILSMLVALISFTLAHCQSKEIYNSLFDLNTPLKTRQINSYKQVLDPETGLNLTWTVNLNLGVISFLVESSRQNGFVALALTKRGKLHGADVIVVGKGNQMSPYVLDMHGTENETIALDKRQDWFLDIGANLSLKTQGIRVKIQRNLDSCDDQDMVIGNEQIVVAYSTGSGTDAPTKFVLQREKPIYFFDPYILPESSTVRVENFQQWRLSSTFQMPPRLTTNWCTIHKLRASLSTKHHIIGFKAFVSDMETRRHVHHQILYRCVAPPGINPDAFFGPFLEHPGEECYVIRKPSLPSAFCREMVHTFGIGGEPVLFPESVGISLSPNEYFMFEAHYDNPNRTSGITVENGVDLYYTPQLRPNEGSIIFTGQGILGTYIVPPKASNFTVAGHCSPECSEMMIPPEGLDIIGVTLHGHTSTRKMRFRQFRASTELPWILNDEEYDFQYQQIRFLENPRRFMPGDQLTVECTYSTEWKNGEAVSSGFSTRDEMCMAFLILVGKQFPYLYCTSEYNTDRTMERFGIQNMTWNEVSQERVINAADNPNITGLTLSQVVERQSWTTEKVQQLERDQRYSNHVASCFTTRFSGEENTHSNEIANFAGGSSTELPLLDKLVPTTLTMRTAFPQSRPVRYPQGEGSYSPSGLVCE